MSLTERYIYAVTKLLPQNQRTEVADELRASIEDMASDRAKNGEPKEADVKAVLQELGDPTVLASKYTNTKRYLIGPKWFDTYWSVLKQILYIVPAIVVCVMLVVNYAISGKSWIETIIHSLGSGIATAIQIGFWTTITFFALERSGEVSPQDLVDAKTKNKKWTPDDLPFPPKARQIPAVEAWISVALIIAATAWVAFSSIWGNNWLNPELWNIWMPIFFVLSAASALHYVFRAIIGNWTTPLTVSNVILSVLNIIYVIALISTQTIINPEFLQSLPMKDGINIGQATNWIHLTVTISAVVTVAIYAFEVIDSIIKNRRYVASHR